ncbi:MAG TPA: proton-conducting transporter membrane subunit [Candidatus Bathyarchaeia archaeon]|nr:proton-conducting transporter membrane subunit [Candidatus Bathyarchaeia archaeon]
MYAVYILAIPLIAAAICALFGRNARIAAYTAITGMTLSAVLFTVSLFFGTSALTALDSYATVAGLSTVGLGVAYVVIIIGALVTWYSLPYMEHVGRIYYPLLLVIISSTAAAVLSTNVATLYVFFEVATLSTAILVTYRRGRAFEAATKFVILNSIGSSFTLIALILMFVNYGTLNIASFGTASDSAIALMSLFLFVGLGTKIGVVPMHSWVPDTYAEAPTPVSTFLAGTVKAATAFMLIRFLFALHPALDVVLLFIAVTAVITVGVGAFMAYTQTDLKRFLAYSSIEQAGIILFAVGIGTSASLTGGIYQIINNMIMKSLVFLCVGAVIAATRQRNISGLGGLVTKMPIVAGGFLIGALALSGIPPLNGFISEYLILQAGFQRGGFYPLLSGLLLVLTFPMFAGYVKVFQRVFLTVDKKKETSEMSYLSIYIIIPIIILSVLCVLMGVFPTAIVDQLSKLSVAILGG